mmetsp:Transcript_54253/g.58809  ORF Transcript_54253/g.58809 Transcript_54253/m.58809 type:complete len:99 (-) Transcript_54253:152-448(-)
MQEQQQQEPFLQQRRRQRKFATITTTTTTLTTEPRDSVAFASTIASAPVKSLSITGTTAQQQQRKQHMTDMQNTYTQLHIRLKQKLTTSSSSSSIISR